MDTQFILDNNQVEGQGSNQVTLNNSPQHLCIPKLLQMWHQMHSQDILNKQVLMHNLVPTLDTQTQRKVIIQKQHGHRILK
jgi:FMN-dependent NADH-azoreductase